MQGSHSLIFLHDRKVEYSTKLEYMAISRYRPMWNHKKQYYKFNFDTTCLLSRTSCPIWKVEHLKNQIFVWSGLFEHLEFYYSPSLFNIMYLHTKSCLNQRRSQQGAKNLAHTIYIYTSRQKHLYTTANFDRLHQSLKGFSYLRPIQQMQKAMPDATILLYAHDHKRVSKLLSCFNFFWIHS
jgi:hypothetical protein